jgi:hypothetical protein
MSIRAYLDGQKFDGETIRLMGIAFEMALASFGATLDHDDPIRPALAQRIIALAQAGERDVERLCEGALLGASPMQVLVPEPLLHETIRCSRAASTPLAGRARG